MQKDNAPSPCRSSQHHPGSVLGSLLPLTFPPNKIHAHLGVLVGTELLGVRLNHSLDHLLMSFWEDEFVPLVVLLN